MPRGSGGGGGVRRGENWQEIHLRFLLCSLQHTQEFHHQAAQSAVLHLLQHSNSQPWPGKQTHWTPGKNLSSTQHYSFPSPCDIIMTFMAEGFPSARKMALDVLLKFRLSAHLAPENICSQPRADLLHWPTPILPLQVCSVSTSDIPLLFAVSLWLWYMDTEHSTSLQSLLSSHKHMMMMTTSTFIAHFFINLNAQHAEGWGGGGGEGGRQKVLLNFFF